MKRSIYLDWNIFQDIIQERGGEGLEENLSAAVKSGYIVPYSCAHIRDLSRCSNQSYIDNDIKALSDLTRDWCVGVKINDAILYYEIIPPSIVLKAIREQNQKEENYKETSIIGFPEFKVDLQKMSNDNIIIPYLKRNNLLMSHKVLEEFICDLYENIFSDYKLQKKFRASLAEVVRINNPAFGALLDMPLYKHLLSHRDDIINNLNEIIDSFLSITGKSINSIELGEKITTAYNLLDFFPAFSEKLQKRNNINNITTDAEHIFLASSSTYLVCGDRNMVQKTKIIYNLFNIKTRIFLRDDFIQRITFA